MKTLKKASLALSIQAVLFASSVVAQDNNEDETKIELEQITVTAQKRTQSIQEVPISVATLSGEKFENMFSAGDDVLALANRVPGLYAESSNGRIAPRFYIRGLGNSDFDLAASQPVSIVMDDVVKENVILKSFPLFDVERVEVIRGPQGTLFGRNTTAGIVKFDTRRPRDGFDAFIETAIGSYGTFNLEGAVGNSITDELSFRLSGLSQNRDDWVDNGFTGEKDVMGGYHENAGRLQFLYDTGDLTALLSMHTRDLDGTSTLFRANIVEAGTTQLNENYDRETIYYDGGDNNPQEYENHGAKLHIEKLFDSVSVTSISAYETADGRSKGDIDGGNAGTDLGASSFPAVTEDQLNDLRQFTQEIRVASLGNEKLDWQVGAFLFDSSFGVTTIDGFFGTTTVYHDNETWAVFGQSSYELTDRLEITGGIRYTEDEKSFRVGEQNVNGFAVTIGAAAVQDYDDINVDDGQVSWELAANYELTDNANLFSRVAQGFRAQTIQGRDVAFEKSASVADAETIDSFEIGLKSDLFDRRLRLNTALFYYEIDDIQLSAIGGQTQGNQLINADKGVGQGFEVDVEYLAADNLTLTMGYSYNHTELDDEGLEIAPCGSMMCSVTDPLAASGNALVDGNPFPQAPEQVFNMTARYTHELDSGEIFVLTDWAWQGDTNLFIYEAIEFKTSGNFEGGLRIGYENFRHDYKVSVFGRNITDEDNIKGAIDFNNNTLFMNEPRVFGVEFRMNFY